MKKTLITSILVASTLFLTGCSSASFDNITLAKSPEWDISKVTNGAWGNEDFDSADRDTSDSVYIKLYNKDKSCYIDGRIAFFTPEDAKTKDKTNSSKYLNDLGLQNINSKEFKVEETTINNVRYVVGEYQLPEGFGAYSYHKTAVRVFSSKVAIPNVNEESSSYPMVIIDMACKSEKEINKENWDKASSFFNLILAEEAVVIENEYGEVAEPPADNPNADLPENPGVPLSPEEAAQQAEQDSQ